MENTLPKQFFATANKFSKRVAMRYKKDNAWLALTFSEVEKSVVCFSRGLAELGFKTGDRLAVLSENRPEWVVADLSAMSLGGISVTVHTTFSPKLVAHVLKDSAAKFLVVSNQEQLTKVLLYLKELPDLQKIIFLDLAKPINDIVSIKQLSFNDVIELGKNYPALPEVETSKDNVASYIYTSGTTGTPNGVVLTHHNFLSNAAAALERVPVTERDTLLSFLPLSHVLERTAGYYAPLVLAGACIAYAESPKTVINDLKQVKPTILISVPRIFEKFHKSIWEKVKSGSSFKKKLFLRALRQKKGTIRYKIFDFLVFRKIRAALGGRFRLTISGGASLNPQLARFFDKIGIVILEGYGMTETSPVICANRQGKIKYGTVGTALSGVEVKIASDKEILVRGPNVMKCYTTLKRETLMPDGWFQTGDLGFLDGDGYLTIIGRKKEMMVLSNGKNVWPEKIEFVLNDDRFINQTMILGNSRPFAAVLIVPDWNEVKLFRKGKNLPHLSASNLVEDPDTIKLYQERLDNYKENFAQWEFPKKFVLLEREFSQENEELTPTLKLRRKVIEEHYYRQVEKIYS